MARAPRRTLKERREAALADVEAAKAKLAALEAAAAERIGRLAIRAGLVDLELTDEELTKEFDAIASKFQRTQQTTETNTYTGGASQSSHG